MTGVQTCALPISYLELMGVDSASKLITGKGKPPQEDPQVFLGAMSLSPPFLSPSRHSLPSVQVSYSKQIHTAPFFSQFLYISNNLFVFKSFYLFPSNLILPAHLFRLLYNYLGTLHNMSNRIRHPQLHCLNKTDYAIFNPETMYCGVIHVGQISKYLAFDKSLRDGSALSKLLDVPIGYVEFAKTFNTGTHPQDKWHLSTITFSLLGEQIIKSNNPVHLSDFFITPEQCGLAPLRNGPTEAQVFVFEEYATTMAMQNRR